MVTVAIKELMDDLFNEEGNWGEWEPREVKGLGWAIYSVEDMAGSIAIYVTEERNEEPPKDNYIGFKVSYNGGSFGQGGSNDGHLFSNLKNNLYRTRDTFFSDKELREILTDKLEELI